MGDSVYEIGFKYLSDTEIIASVTDRRHLPINIQCIWLPTDNAQDYMNEISFEYNDIFLLETYMWQLKRKLKISENRTPALIN